MSSYGTRRNSAIQLGASPQAIPVPLPASPYSPNLALSPTLSSSVGKSKTTKSTKSRRLSTSAHSGRPSGLATSLPAGGLAGRGRAGSVSQGGVDGLDDDAALAASGGKARKDKGQTFECEKCSKVYRHSTCLTKHRWHWKEASKLLLSKHQQVQLLEGAAILAAASAGTSLPDEKSFWPAAVSPPASGLLGSSEFGINIHALSASGPQGFGSPRFTPSSLLSDGGDFDASRSEVSIDEDDEDDEDDGQSPPRAGSSDPDEDQLMMEDGMFDLDLGGSGELPPPSPLPPAPIRLPTLNDRHASPSTASDASSNGIAVRPSIRSSDSGFGSVSRGGTIKDPSLAATAAAASAAAQQQQAPQSALGFFPVPPRQ
ncbi:hypothetical protein JCM8097_003319 [Rhodosporidiobolus ruineniae]